MLKSRTLFVAAVSPLPMFMNQAVGYFYSGHPACPWNDTSHTWAKFLNKEYGGQDPFFSIQFTRHIGDIEGGRCYTIFYHGNENWDGAGKIRNQNKSKNDSRHGGDPTKLQINVWGAQFTYNEAGEVYYVPDGQLAGNMYCHIGSECWK